MTLCYTENETGNSYVQTLPRAQLLVLAIRRSPNGKCLLIFKVEINFVICWGLVCPRFYPLILRITILQEIKGKFRGKIKFSICSDRVILAKVESVINNNRLNM